MPYPQCNTLGYPVTRSTDRFYGDLCAHYIGILSEGDVSKTNYLFVSFRTGIPSDFPGCSFEMCNVTLPTSGKYLTYFYHVLFMLFFNVFGSTLHFFVSPPTKIFLF